MAARLKVFVTSDGLTDYVVAASSRPKALAAWDVRQDLFKEGRAREAPDDPWAERARAAPETVLRRDTGAAEQLPAAAAGPRKAPKLQTVTPQTATPKDRLEPRKPPPPTPGEIRSAEHAVRKAEQALQHAGRAHAAALEGFDAQQAELDRRRRAAEREHEKATARLEAAVKTAEDALAALKAR